MCLFVQLMCCLHWSEVWTVYTSHHVDADAVCGPESPDVMKFLRHVIRLCFPDNINDLFSHTDGRYATSPLALMDVLDRLQHRVTCASPYLHSVWTDLRHRPIAQIRAKHMHTSLCKLK